MSVNKDCRCGGTGWLRLEKGGVNQSLVPRSSDVIRECRWCKYGNNVDMLHNRIALLEEDLECVHIWLDDFVFRGGERPYSLVGRIRRILEPIAGKLFQPMKLPVGCLPLTERLLISIDELIDERSSARSDARYYASELTSQESGLSAPLVISVDGSAQTSVAEFNTRGGWLKRHKGDGTTEEIRGVVSASSTKE